MTPRNRPKPKSYSQEIEDYLDKWESSLDQIDFIVVGARLEVRFGLDFHEAQQCVLYWQENKKV